MSSTFDQVQAALDAAIAEVTPTGANPNTGADATGISDFSISTGFDFHPDSTVALYLEEYPGRCLTQEVTALRDGTTQYQL